MSEHDGNRAYVIDSTDRRGLIVITATVLMSWMILCFCIRLYTRIWITGSCKWDDLFAGVGTAVGVAQVGVTLRAVGNGLGKTNELLSPIELRSSQKVVKDAYIANLLLIIGHCAAKTSILFLLRRIHSDKAFVRICNTVLTVIFLWIIASALAMSLQCNMSDPWFFDKQCDAPTLRWQIIAAFDLLIEIALFVMSVSLVWNLHMRWTGKAIVVGSFGCRLLIIPICVIRLYYLEKVWESFDPSLESADLVILSQFLLHYSIMAATIPCVKPFVIAFNTGWGQGLSSGGSNHYYYKRSALNTINNPAGSDQNARLPNPNSSSFEDTYHHEAHISTGASLAFMRSGDERCDSTSNSHIQNMTIRQTREWSVEHECIEMDEHPRQR
ncbi:hypothetical protein BGW36DRAFT_425884 [Talaromyces proteolyticus]|uniref:Rhodopsin domain-containing protein n=1 Tax=Talaromyces proteolyticus TaxID=1131652 RepID=A0AAD4KX39_9EURO|nr:uncharacterized protein BGW36DRAFT_425884 [Talaromyces proteolyticus]KAH8701088.1 hypothetical protein BGW36DRAFT_425884 [Talaromyces proteolyticus]